MHGTHTVRTYTGEHVGCTTLHHSELRTSQITQTPRNEENKMKRK
jgi:hypothetical protein